MFNLRRKFRKIVVNQIYNNHSSFLLFNFFLFDAPRHWQMNFQDSASLQMDAITDFHQDLMCYLIFIVIFVAVMLYSTLSLFSEPEEKIITIKNCIKLYRFLECYFSPMFIFCFFIFCFFIGLIFMLLFIFLGLHIIENFQKNHSNNFWAFQKVASKNIFNYIPEVKNIIVKKNSVVPSYFIDGTIKFTSTSFLAQAKNILLSTSLKDNKLNLNFETRFFFKLNNNFPENYPDYFLNAKKNYKWFEHRTPADYYKHLTEEYMVPKFDDDFLTCRARKYWSYTWFPKIAFFNLCNCPVDPGFSFYDDYLNGLQIDIKSEKIDFIKKYNLLKELTPTVVFDENYEKTLNDLQFIQKDDDNFRRIFTLPIIDDKNFIRNSTLLKRSISTFVFDAEESYNFLVKSGLDHTKTMATIPPLNKYTAESCINFSRVKPPTFSMILLSEHFPTACFYLPLSENLCYPDLQFSSLDQSVVDRILKKFSGGWGTILVVPETILYEEYPSKSLFFDTKAQSRILLVEVKYSTSMDGYSKIYRDIWKHHVPIPKNTWSLVNECVENKIIKVLPKLYSKK